MSQLRASTTDNLYTPKVFEVAEGLGALDDEESAEPIGESGRRAVISGLSDRASVDSQQSSQAIKSQLLFP